MLDEFRPSSLTCVSAYDGQSVFVRGIFTELADELGTVAIVSITSPHQSVTSWQRYLEETATTALQFDGVNSTEDAGQGLIAWVTAHPRADEARRLHQRSRQRVQYQTDILRLQTIPSPAPAPGT